VNLFEGHTQYVLGVAFRSDGRVLASAGGDGVVLVWDMIHGERKKKIEGWGKEVTSLQFIGATSQIVTSAGDNLVRIVNDDGAVVRAIDKLPDFMQAAASTASASVVIGGGEDSFLRVWDGTTGKELAAFGAK
jgi:WD40 repeat protein